MKLIKKANEPTSLTNYKRRNPNNSYSDLDSSLRQNIRKSCLEEQFYLCAYCCCEIIDENDCHNEHIKSQKKFPHLTLDYDNIVASCNNKRQCGYKKANNQINLTPLMKNCETYIEFKISGGVKGRTADANTTIDILNLGRNKNQNRVIYQKRKSAIEAILYTELNSINIKVEDFDIIKIVIDNLKQPNSGNKLQSFSPVIINALENYMDNNSI